MKPIYIIGHRNPDNDSIISAVCYAWLKNKVNPDREYIACCLGDLPKESEVLLQQLDMPLPRRIHEIAAPQDGEEKQKVILVDHNELSQAIEGLQEHAEVIEILDHHRIADVQTSQPILFINLPIGSTASIVATRFDHYGVEIDERMAALLLSAMMTDMVMMKSPTTTPFDRKLAARLGAIIGKDPAEYGAQIFRSRGAGDFTPEQICARDTKRFEIGDLSVYIGQYETVDKNATLKDLTAIRQAMNDFMVKNGGDSFVLLITDIIEEGSHVLACGQTEVIGRGLGIEICDEGTWMPGVLSRKKQVAAPLIEAV